MTPNPNKLRVVHFPQVGSCKEFFSVEVKNEQEAFLIIQTLANQHLWLHKNKIIPDYSNSIFVEEYSDEINGETGEPFGWSDYWNEESGLSWDEVEEILIEQSNNK